MSLFELFLIYVLSWWMVLFIVLPIGVRIPADPGKGHAASAPHNPRLKRKLLITTLLAFLFPLGALGISQARAASGIYHAGTNDCAEPADLQADSDVNAIDSDATIGGSSNAKMGVVPTYLDTPASEHTSSGQIDRLGASYVNVGIAETNTETGEVRINGTPVGTHATKRPADCK